MRSNTCDTKRKDNKRETDSSSYQKASSSHCPVISSSSLSTDVSHSLVEIDDYQRADISSTNSCDTNATISSYGSNGSSIDKNSKRENPRAMKSQRSFFACGLCMVMNSALSFFIVEKRRVWTHGHVLPMICDVAEFGFLIATFSSFTGSILASAKQEWTWFLPGCISLFISTIIYLIAQRTSWGPKCCFKTYERIYFYSRAR